MENNLTLRSPVHIKISRMVEIKRKIDELKTEYAQLESFFLKKSEEDLADTKRKTVSYLGAGGKVTATMAEKVNVVYPSYLKGIFGEAYRDAVTEDVKHKLSAQASRMLAGMWTGDYSKTTRAEIISQLPCDETARLTLLKKLKGANFDTDKKHLMTIGGVDGDMAEQYAFFIAEAAIWESFTRLMQANGIEDADAIARVMKLIDGAIVVEETPKVTFEILEASE